MSSSTDIPPSAEIPMEEMEPNGSSSTSPRGELLTDRRGRVITSIGTSLTRRHHHDVDSDEEDGEELLPSDSYSPEKGKEKASREKQAQRIAAEAEAKKDYSANMFVIVQSLLFFIIVFCALVSVFSFMKSSQLKDHQPYLATQKTLAMYSEKGELSMQLQILERQMSQLDYFGAVLAIYGVFAFLCFLNLHTHFPPKFGYYHSLVMRLPLHTSIGGGIVLNLLMLIPLVDSYKLDPAFNQTMICCGIMGIIFIAVGNILRRFYGNPSGNSHEERWRARFLLLLISSGFYVIGFVGTISIDIYLLTVNHRWFVIPDKKLNEQATLYITFTSFINVIWGAVMISENNMSKARTLLMEFTKLFFMFLAMGIHFFFLYEILDQDDVLEKLMFREG
jgi:hypothetical protein